MPDRFQPESAADLMRRYRQARERAAEPFYSTELPCEDCGQPLSACACDAPDEPICFALYPLIMAARSVGEIVEVCRAHREKCPACQSRNEQPDERKKAA